MFFPFGEDLRVEFEGLFVVRDCALFIATAGMATAVSTDTLVCGRHFFSDVVPQTLGHKALAVNLSDLAAMGATPRFFTLALTLPHLDHAWLKAFADGMFALAAAHNISLIGGDTTSGPLAITITVLGEVPPALALKRANTQAGDDIWVSGALGCAALALKHLQKKLALAPSDFTQCATALFMPTPRVELGVKLRKIAHSAIDISDGLLADLAHICAASNVVAQLDFAAIIGPKLTQNVPEDDLITAILAGGDDYELCFTAPVSARPVIVEIATELALPCTRIGQILPAAKVGAANLVSVINLKNSVVPSLRGYDHFASP